MPQYGDMIMLAKNKRKNGKIGVMLIQKFLTNDKLIYYSL